MEHVSSVRPTGKFPGKLENLKKWAHFPGWNFQRNFVFHLHVSRSLYQFQVHGKKICDGQLANQNGFPRSHVSMHGLVFCWFHNGGTFAPRVPWPWINW